MSPDLTPCSHLSLLVQWELKVVKTLVCPGGTVKLIRKRYRYRKQSEDLGASWCQSNGYRQEMKLEIREGRAPHSSEG